ncbi:uncharacterized protein LOC121719306 [Xyrichtys novacula]|uniref:THAP domain-containing protein 1 n=1 Tax=Xyrichtys novacula TaxID=13765 RepID=A0AAV1FE65_XYRNO|nr:uncharacterized protein LOC121719306 [Xyrichtys novacula]
MAGLGPVPRVDGTLKETWPRVPGSKIIGTIKIYMCEIAKCKVVVLAMAERQRYCALCKSRTRTLHALPKDPELIGKWLEIIFGCKPERYSSKLSVCAQHFKETDFTNFGQFHSGFADKLLLKPEAVPSRLSIRTTLRFKYASCQTDPPSLCNRGTQLSVGTLRHHVKSRGTQTTAASETTATTDETLTYTPIRPRPAKRRRLAVEEEDEGEDSSVIPPPLDSTYEPDQTMTDVSESSKIV